ncbi:hypothetical protein BDV12DRAFT_179919 [Aspergillus spectabilis]
MLPTFHMNKFKPWPPPHQKPFPPHKSLNPCSPSTLPPPKHHLPVRPPAEACVPSSTNPRLYTPLNPQSKPREISEPPSNTSSLEKAKHGPTFLQGSIAQTTNSDLLSPCDSLKNIDTSIEPPSFRGDATENGFSSPSTSSSDNSLEESFRLADAQDNLFIDPLILTLDEPWEAGDPQCPDEQVSDDITISGTICQYPNPPPMLADVPECHQVSARQCISSENSNSQLNGHPCTQICQQSDSSDLGKNSNASCLDSSTSGSYSCKQSGSGKRKTLQLQDEQAPKRLCPGPSISPAEGNSFISLKSHFLSLPLEERLQFLSWLFEGALPRCMPDPTRTTCEDRTVWSEVQSTSTIESSQTQCDSCELRESSRKGRSWSKEEMDLLERLRMKEKRPWSEVVRIFSDQYPGRTPTSIQVWWGKTLKKRDRPQGQG